VRGAGRVTATPYGPCQPWPLTWTCQLAGNDSPAVTGLAARAATEALWALSGRQFGPCEVLLRPCRSDCGPTAPWAAAGPWPGSSGYPAPALVAGEWVNLTCGTCAGDCTCQALSEVLLPAPVHEVLQVKVDGALLLEVPAGGAPPVTGGWRVYDARRLVRVGGTWPACQQLEAGDDQPGTWSVLARYGQEVPELGRLAAGELACEVLRGLRGEDCRLPRNLVSLVRQGVSLSFPDPAEQVKARLVGLPWGDLFIRTFNPGRLARRAKVYDPDAPAAARPTQPP
jgi:hypothetical protein